MSIAVSSNLSVSSSYHKMLHSTFLFNFDIHDGPILTDSLGDLKLTKEQIDTIKINCFPESAKSLSDTNIFCFTIDDYYCYTSFISIYNPSYERNYQQFSIVIVSTLTYYPLFFELMESINTVINKMDINMIMSLLDNFVGKWEKHFESLNYSDFELPMLNGSVKVNSNPKSRDLLKGFQNKYFLNSYYFGNDLIKSLNCDFDGIVKIWERLVTDRNVMIYADTPKSVTDGSFAVASLIYPEIVPKVTPYISVTDPRFMNLIKTEGLVFGTSNPISLTIANNKTFIYKIEQNPKNQQMTSSQIRHKLYIRTRTLRKILERAIDRQIQINFLSVVIGKINSKIILDEISKQKFETYENCEKFSKLLSHSKLCDKIRKERLLTSNALIQYLSLNISSKFKINTLKKIYVSLIHVLEIETISESNQLDIQMKIKQIAKLIQ